MRLKPKKSLGQNFLVDQNIQRKIIEACNFSKSDVVLEIGAGAGQMTCELARKIEHIYAIEVDKNLCKILEDNLKECNNLRVINKDFLKFDINGCFAKFGQKIKVIGNIPYYITTPIIEHVLESKNIVKEIFLTVQKEFAQRIICQAGSKKYGSLSCFLQYYTKPEIKFIIGRKCFYPAPKVDSCFLKLEVLDSPSVKVNDEKLFFRIIRSAFNQRRKILRNSLLGILSESKLEVFFEEFGINKNIRPEELSLNDFANLANV